MARPRLTNKKHTIGNLPVLTYGLTCKSLQPIRVHADLHLRPAVTNKELIVPTAVSREGARMPVQLFFPPSASRPAPTAPARAAARVPGSPSVAVPAPCAHWACTGLWLPACGPHPTAGLGVSPNSEAPRAVRAPKHLHALAVRRRGGSNGSTTGHGGWAWFGIRERTPEYGTASSH